VPRIGSSSSRSCLPIEHCELAHHGFLARQYHGNGERAAVGRAKLDQPPAASLSFGIPHRGPHVGKKRDHAARDQAAMEWAMMWQGPPFANARIVSASRAALSSISSRQSNANGWTFQRPSSSAISGRYSGRSPATRTCFCGSRGAPRRPVPGRQSGR